MCGFLICTVFYMYSSLESFFNS